MLAHGPVHGVLILHLTFASLPHCCCLFSLHTALQLWVNNDYVDLPGATTRGASLTSPGAAGPDGGNDTCTACQPESLCQNGGVCLAKLSSTAAGGAGDEFECLCNLTGFGGPLCEIGEQWRWCVVVPCPAVHT